MKCQAEQPPFALEYYTIPNINEHGFIHYRRIIFKTVDGTPLFHHKEPIGPVRWVLQVNGLCKDQIGKCFLDLRERGNGETR